MSDTRKFLEAVMDGRTPVQSYNPATRRYEDKYLRYNDAKEEIEELGSVGFGQSMMPKAQNVPQGNMQNNSIFNMDINTNANRLNIPYNQINDREPLVKSMQNNFYDYRPQDISPTWGDETEKVLDKYLEERGGMLPQSGRTNTGIKAAYDDIMRNYHAMKKLELIGGDKFFHCKANYEATKRKPFGEETALLMDTLREVYGMAKGDSLQDMREDWKANRMGIDGANEGKLMLEACPSNPRYYR